MWPNASFRACVSCWFISERSFHRCKWGVKSPPLLLCYCWFFLLCLLAVTLYIVFLLFWMYIYLKLLYLLLGLILWSLCNVLPCLFNILYFKVYFVWYEHCYSSFLLIPICMKYFLPSSRFQFLGVPRSEVGLLKTAYIWILFLYAFSQSMSFGWGIESINI